MSKNFLFRLDGPGEGGGAISEVIDIQSHKESAAFGVFLKGF